MKTLIPFRSAILGLILGLALSLTASGTDTQAALREASKSTKRFTSAGVSTTSQRFYAEELSKLPIKLRPGREHRKDSSATPIAEEKCKSTVYQTLSKLPKEHVAQLLELTLFYTPDGRRGLGGGNSIILRCTNVAKTELAGVLMHEMGHLVDAETLRGTDESGFSGFYDFGKPVLVDDPSAAFFQICWISESQRRANSSELDFVSGYAMSDPFEDFAETYAYYRLHGKEFRSLASSNKHLAAKYEFMKNSVFAGKEFETGSSAPVKEEVRNYDVTVLPYSFTKFLTS